MKLLTYVNMKIDRANHHLHALDRIFRPLFEEPHSVVTREDTQSSLYIRRTYCKKIPDTTAMLLGEFLYCLRSGLDQLAWQLALTSSKQTRPRGIYFPICTVTTGQKKREFENALKCFPSDVATEIDAVQPYKETGGPESHALWQLHFLCNLDKHCVVPFSCTHTKVHVPLTGVAEFLEFEDAIEVRVPIEDKLDLDSKPNATFDIEIGEWEADIRIPVYRLADIHNFVRDEVIPRFTKFDTDVVDSPSHRTDGLTPVYESYS